MATRREFLGAASVGVASRFSKTVLAAATEGQARATEERTFSVFTKHLLGLKPEPLADALASIGVTAIEAPIRPGGHVEPVRVVDELPPFVEALKTRGIRVALISTGINAVAPEQYTEIVLRTARKLEVPRYRMNWYTYDLKKPVWSQVEEIRPRLKDLVALSKEIGILPCYQNHSGSHYVGAPVWDMALLMRDHRQDELGWCFDPMHATIEGSMSWPIEANLVRDRVAVLNFKNFAWRGKGHKDVALGDGVVGPEHVAAFKDAGYRGPVNLHVEYLEGSIRDPGYLEKALQATRRDLALLKSWWS